MPVKKPYTHVRLILHEDGRGLMDRYEVRVSTFVEFDQDKGRRAISGHPTKGEAEDTAKRIAREARNRQTMESGENSMTQSLRDLLAEYQQHIVWAEERIRMFETGQLGYEDIGPPRRDVRDEAIQNARTLIENYRKGIEIIEKMLKDRES